MSGVVRRARRLENLVAWANFDTYTSSGTPYWSPSGQEIIERVHQSGERGSLFRDVDEDVTRRAVAEHADVDVALVLSDTELAAEALAP